MKLQDTDRFVYLPVRNPENHLRDHGKAKIVVPAAIVNIKKDSDVIPMKRQSDDINSNKEKVKVLKTEKPDIPKAMKTNLKVEKQDSLIKAEFKPKDVTKADNSIPKIDNPKLKPDSPKKPTIEPKPVQPPKPTEAHFEQEPRKQKPRIAIDSCTVVRENEKDYEIIDPENFTLAYPNGIEKFLLAHPKSDDYDPIDDIYTTVQLIHSDCIPPEKQHLLGDKNKGIVRNIVRACHKKNFVDLKLNLVEFNKVMKELKDEGVFNGQGKIASSPDLILHAFNQAYARSIAPHANQLNKYQGLISNRFQ